ncbi:hypothetical protein CUN61_31300 [Pseudomonas arsenicoxydans]|uniref:DUF1534 domain-containing protein n=1 Tax=Pseudomonas arsenicoxydans TaxID=702115 RepID=A0A4P6G914_9PSED|nr:hypothetical protein CUN61_31300 [Pseudomonas arsenicoxydans]
MLRVGMHPVTLRVTLRKTQAWCRQRNAERPRRHSHAERGNDQPGPCSGFIFVRDLQLRKPARSGETDPASPLLSL